jgi:nucleoside-diphosphate-sugar epimerase
MKVLVTGSSGFVGRHVVAELKNRKHEVREFDLSNGDDMLDKAQLKKALKGTDAVIHLAAIVENGSPRLWEVNVEGTRNVIDEAIAAKAERFIYLGSTGVYGVAKGEVSEKSRAAPENDYEKSKLEAEKIVLERQEEISVSVLRSAMVFGANDYWKKMFRMLEKNYPLPCPGTNHYQDIDAADLARALVLVLEKGEDGETYLVAGEDAPTLNEFCEMGKEALGKKGKMRHMPARLAPLMGKLLGMSLLTKENIRHLGKERRYDLRKIKALGFSQKRSMKDSIMDAVENMKRKELL